jgi:hypothetical protein
MVAVHGAAKVEPPAGLVIETLGGGLDAAATVTVPAIEL